MADPVPRENYRDAALLAKLSPADRAEIGKGGTLYQLRDSEQYVTLPRLVRQWFDGFNYAVSVPISQPGERVRNYLVPFPKWPLFAATTDSRVPAKDLYEWADIVENAPTCDAEKANYVANLFRRLSKYSGANLSQQEEAIARETSLQERDKAQTDAKNWQVQASSASSPSSRSVAFLDQVDRTVAVPNRVRDALLRSGARFESAQGRWQISLPPWSVVETWTLKEPNAKAGILINVGSVQRLQLPLFQTPSRSATGKAIDSFLTGAMALYQRFSSADIAIIDAYYEQKAASAAEALVSKNVLPQYGRSRPPPMPFVRGNDDILASESSRVLDKDNNKIDDESALRVLLETWRLYKVGLVAHDSNSAAAFGVRGGVLPTSSPLAEQNVALEEEVQRSVSLYSALDDTNAFQWLRAHGTIPSEAIDVLQNDYSEWYRSLFRETQATEGSSARKAFADSPRNVWLYASDEWPRATDFGVGRAQVLLESARFASHQAKKHFGEWLLPLANGEPISAVTDVLSIVQKTTPPTLANTVGLAALVQFCGNELVPVTEQTYLLWSAGPNLSPLHTGDVVGDVSLWRLETKQPVRVSDYVPFSPLAFDERQRPRCLSVRGLQPRFFIVERAPLAVYHAVRPDDFLILNDNVPYRLFAINYASTSSKLASDDVLWNYVDNLAAPARRQWYASGRQAAESGFGSAVPFPSYADEHRAELLWYERV
jgi:hypothetical protein